MPVSADTNGRYPALFLDRDGVIIENRANYVRSWGDVEIFPEAIAALRWIRNWPCKIVIVTNQSAIGRRLLPPHVAMMINRRLVKLVEAAGGRIDRVFMCPHIPESGCCCRKPEPGMLWRAQRALNLDLSRSLLIGDALTDLQAGRAAGLPLVALVRTGRGADQEIRPEAAQLRPFPVYDTLADALKGLATSKFPAVQPAATMQF